MHVKVTLAVSLQLKAVCIPAKGEVLHYELGEQITCIAVTQHCAHLRCSL